MKRKEKSWRRRRRDRERRKLLIQTLSSISSIFPIFIQTRNAFCCKKLKLEATESFFSSRNPRRLTNQAKIFSQTKFVFMNKSLVSLHHALVNVLEAEQPTVIRRQDEYPKRGERISSSLSSLNIDSCNLLCSASLEHY